VPGTSRTARRLRCRLEPICNGPALTEGDTVITRVTGATPSEWDSHWQAAPHATFFESRQWAQVWASYAPNTSSNAWLVEFSDGTTIVIPFVTESRLGGRVRLSRMSPADTYGGWLAPRDLGDLCASLVRRLIERELGNIRWVVNPFLLASTGESLLPDATSHTLALDLSHGFDACRRRWSKGHRSAATKAAREGVTVRQAASQDDWRAYFEIYSESLKRWGRRASSRYHWPLFEALSRLDPTLVRLWVAMVDDQMAAGALCLYHPNQVAYWHGAALERHFPLRPTNLLMQAAIQDACLTGAKWFDLGPSGGHQGVERFKVGFSPTSLGFGVIDRSTAMVASIRAVRRVVRGGVRRLT